MKSEIKSINDDKDIIIKLSIYKYEFHNEAKVS